MSKGTKKVLIVIDMQRDFIDGALRNRDAKAIVPNVVKKIEQWDDDIIMTMDTHNDKYLDTREGRYLPIKHCIKKTAGWYLDKDVCDSVVVKGRAGFDINLFPKDQFGHKDLWEVIRDYREIEIVGICTDICVVTNALLLRTFLPEARITVDASCCAGTTPEAHNAALMVMKSCQIDIINHRN